MDVHDLHLRDLQGVAAVAAHGHFGRAARALGVSQPTLSARVQRVEAALGAVLFERSSRRFLVTAEGERLLPLVRETLDASQRLSQGARAGDGRGGGRRLRLGVIPTLGPFLAPHLLGALGAERAGVELTESPTGVLLEALRDGTLDAALLSLPVGRDDLESVALFDEAFVLFAPKEHALLRARPLTPSLLRAGEMVVLDEAHCLRDQALGVCGRRGGARPRRVAASIETLKYLVAAGEGYTLLPRLAAEVPAGLRGMVRVRAFDERVPYRRIGLCYRRSMPVREGLERLAARIAASLPEGVVEVVGGARAG